MVKPHHRADKCSLAGGANVVLSMTRRDGWYGILLGVAILAFSGYAALTRQTYIRSHVVEDPYGGTAGWIGVGLGSLLILLSIWRLTRD